MATVADGCTVMYYCYYYYYYDCIDISIRARKNVSPASVVLFPSNECKVVSPPLLPSLLYDHQLFRSVLEPDG